MSQRNGISSPGSVSSRTSVWLDDQELERAESVRSGRSVSRSSRAPSVLSRLNEDFTIPPPSEQGSRVSYRPDGSRAGSRVSNKESKSSRSRRDDEHSMPSISERGSYRAESSHGGSRALVKAPFRDGGSVFSDNASQSTYRAGSSRGGSGTLLKAPSRDGGSVFSDDASQSTYRPESSQAGSRALVKASSRNGDSISPPSEQGSKASSHSKASSRGRSGSSRQLALRDSGPLYRIPELAAALPDISDNDSGRPRETTVSFVFAMHSRTIERGAPQERGASQEWGAPQEWEWEDDSGLYY